MHSPSNPNPRSRLITAITAHDTSAPAGSTRQMAADPDQKWRPNVAKTLLRSWQDPYGLWIKTGTAQAKAKPGSVLVCLIWGLVKTEDRLNFRTRFRPRSHVTNGNPEEWRSVYMRTLNTMRRRTYYGLSLSREWYACVTFSTFSMLRREGFSLNREVHHKGYFKTLLRYVLSNRFQCATF